ncbi:MAG: hypothetical protein U5K29_10075 [Acidimicrobiales bacterium]|nr:hypothetical protein [Acidimicrobiales bacterium]
MAFRYGVDARYVGQGNEITIWFPAGTDPDAWPVTDDELLARFEDEYRRIYGLAIPGVGLEIVTWRISALAAIEGQQAEVEPIVHAADPPDSPRPDHVRPARFARDTGSADTLVYRRSQLVPGARFAGPALVEERETTAVIRPGWDVTVLPDGALVAVRDPGGTR